MIAKVWLVEELFYYNYPFSLPNFFQQKLTKHELEVRFKLFQVFTSGSIEKEIVKEYNLLTQVGRREYNILKVNSEAQRRVNGV